MFTPEGRARLRDGLVAQARADARITGAALTGSASRDAEDCWSDIDLALGVASGADIGQVIADWTTVMYRDHQALHHLDVVSGSAVYRVFLLASTLQVDIAFAPEAGFGPTAPTFRLLFGQAAWDEPPGPSPGQTATASQTATTDRPATADRAATADRPATAATADHAAAAGLIGMAWLYALHARSSLARGRMWQAEYMISGVRDHVLALACLRHGLPAAQGRGMDQLPAEVTAGVAAALVRSVEGPELARAFRAATESLIAEIALADAGLATRLASTLTELAAGP